MKRFMDTSFLTGIVASYRDNIYTVSAKLKHSVLVRPGSLGALNSTLFPLGEK